MLRITQFSHIGFDSINKRIKPVVALFNNLIKRIYQAVKSIFSRLNPWQNVQGFFSQKEIRLIQAIHTFRSKHTSNDLSDLNKRQIKKFKIEQAPPDVELLENSKTPPYVYYDESLEEFRRFLRDFSSLFIDIFYESKISKHVDSAKGMAAAMPSMIKSLSTLLLGVGDKTAKPIFQKLSEQKAHVIDPALKKILRMLIRPDPFLLREELSNFLKSKLDNCNSSGHISQQDYINPVLLYATTANDLKKISDFCSSEKKYDDALLQELCTEAIQFLDKKVNLERSQLYQELENELSEEFKAFAPSIEERSEDLISPILTWLILSDYSIPHAELLDPSNLQHAGITDKIFERCLERLVNRKIDQYSSLVERTLQQNLKEITHKTMQVNAHRIADFFSERISELISTSSFSKTFDTLIHQVILPHIKGVNEAQKLKKEHSALIGKAQHALQMSTLDPANIENQTKAKDYLEWIDSYGEKKAFLQNVLIEKYSEQPICTKVIRQLIDAELKIEPSDPDTSQSFSNQEKAVFSEIAETIFELIIPLKRKTDPDVILENADPFDELWERLYFPEEFQEIIKNLFKTTEEFINPETSSLFEIIKTPAIEIIKSVFKLYSKELIKKQLINAIELSFRELADPNHLIELFSLNTLPLINKKLVQLLIGQHFAKNLSKFSPYIYTLISDDKSNHESNLHALQAALIKDIRFSLRDISLESFYITEKITDHDEGNEKKLSTSSISEEDLLLMTKPLINTYEDVILNSGNDLVRFDPKNSTALEIKTILQSYFQTASQINDEVFGNIFIELIFKSGNLSNETLISYFIKDSVSREITAGLAPIRAGHQYLVETVTSSLKATLLNRNYCEYLISNTPTEKPRFIEEKLTHQINMTASLVHQLILGIVQQKGSVTTFAVKKFITNKPAMISGLINKIFNNLFRNYLINANLITALSQKIFCPPLKT